MSDDETITQSQLRSAMRAAERRPGPPVKCWTDEVGEWATVGDLEPVRVVSDQLPQALAFADADKVDRAKALLAKALANNPVDRDIVTEAYRLLVGLPEPEEKT